MSIVSQAKIRFERIRSPFVKRFKNDLPVLDEKKVFSLHPTLLSEDGLRPYLDEFLFALSDSDITNIALSGPYGAGKSTVVRSWENGLYGVDRAKRNTHLPWVYVSLADFSSERGHGDDSENRDVESELLNQLIFKLQYVAPKTRFSVLEKDSLWRDIAKAMAWLLVCASLFLFVSGWVNGDLPLGRDSGYFPFVCGAACLCLAYLFYRVIRSSAVFNLFKRLKVFEVEAELFASETDPAFNRYMDEVVYLLANSKSDVIVFEDIDRFSDILLFEKLRRVNELVNARKENCSRKQFRKSHSEFRPMRFIYLIHDGLFEDAKDRTKFFDLIIPVIPYVDPANSIDVLQRGLNEIGLTVKPDFLYQLSLYVDDPRILKDICNESRHYKLALCAEDKPNSCWDDNKLVAMMAYKALFQRDYELLQVREGFVFSLFNKKGVITNRVMLRYRNRINELNTKLSELDNVAKLESREIKLLYSLVNQSVRQKLSGRSVFSYTDFEDLDSLLEAVAEDKQFQSEIDGVISNLEAHDYSLASKLKVISGDCERQRKEIAQQIAMLERDISFVPGRKLSEILSNSEDLDELFGSNALEALGNCSLANGKYLQMLRFFIVQGYIDETYQLYMSNSYNYTLCDEDKQFLFALFGAHDTEAGYVISNPGALLMRISPEMLSRHCARNYSLFTSLLSFENDEMLKAFLDGVARDDDYPFVVRYVLSSQFVAHSLIALGEKYPSCVKQAICDNTFPVDVRRSFCHRVMSHIESKSLLGAFVDEVRDFANSDRVFLAAKDVLNRDVFTRLLKDIRFYSDGIDFKQADRRFLEAVALDNMYFPDAKNVLGFVSVFSERESLDVKQLNNTLFGSKDSIIRAVADNVLEHIDFYLVSFTSSYDGSFEDCDAVVASILNEGNFGADLPDNLPRAIDRYIKLLPRNAVSDLSLVENVEHKALLLSNNRCVNLTSNICSYLKEFDELQIDSALSGFLKSNGIPEDLNADALRANEIMPAEFLRVCLESYPGNGDPFGLGIFPDIDKTLLQVVADRLNCRFESFEFANGVDSERVSIIIEAGCLAVSRSNILSLRDRCSECVALLASKDLKAYFDIVFADDESIDNGPYIDDEVVRLFEIEGSFDLESSNPFGDDVIAALIRTLTKPISLSTSFSNRVNLALLEDDKDHDALECFCELYSRGDLQLRGALVAESAQYDMHQIKTILKEFSQNRGAALEFLADYLSSYGDNIEREGAGCLVESAGLVDFLVLIRKEKNRISLNMNKSEIRLVHVLQEHGWCGSISNANQKNEKRQVYAGGPN